MARRKLKKRRASLSLRLSLQLLGLAMRLLAYSHAHHYGDDYRRNWPLDLIRRLLSALEDHERWASDQRKALELQETQH